MCAELGPNTFLASLNDADIHRAIYEYIITFGKLRSGRRGGGEDEMNKKDEEKQLWVEKMENEHYSTIVEGRKR